MAPDEAMAQMARNVEQLQSRVHMLESITRPQAKDRIGAMFKRDLSVAVVLLLPKADSQDELARLVSKSIGRRVVQETIGKELRRLKTLGVLSQNTSRTYLIEKAWLDAGLDAELRKKAKKLGVKVAPKRRKSSR